MTMERTHANGKQLHLLHLTWPIFLEVFLFMFMGIAEYINAEFTIR